MLAAMLSCGNIWEGKAFPEKSGHFFICGEAGEITCSTALLD